MSWHLWHMYIRLSVLCSKIFKKNFFFLKVLLFYVYSFFTTLFITNFLKKCLLKNFTYYAFIWLCKIQFRNQPINLILTFWSWFFISWTTLKNFLTLIRISRSWKPTSINLKFQKRFKKIKKKAARQFFYIFLNIFL